MRTRKMLAAVVAVHAVLTAGALASEATRAEFDAAMRLVGAGQVEEGQL